MSFHIIAHVVPYLRSIMHVHFYCYLIGGTAYLLDRGKQWCNSDLQNLKMLDIEHIFIAWKKQEVERFLQTENKRKQNRFFLRRVPNILNILRVQGSS